jgi:hypothetical protein
MVFDYRDELISVQSLGLDWSIMHDLVVAISFSFPFPLPLPLYSFLSFNLIFSSSLKCESRGLADDEAMCGGC